MNDERIDYYEIKRSFLEHCYYYCRNKLDSINKGRTQWFQNEFEIGYAYEQDEDAYLLPLERLTLEVVTLILMAKRGPEQFEIYHRKKIDQILSAHPLDELIKELGEEEREDLLHDMKILQLI